MVDLIWNKKVYLVLLKGVEYILVTKTSYKDEKHETTYEVFLKEDWDLDYFVQVEDWLKEEIIEYQQLVF